MLTKCKGGRTDCSAGWISVIEVSELKNDHRVIVEQRQYDLEVLGDQDAHFAVWKVFDGQTAAESVKPCPSCRPGWIPPRDRQDEDEDLDHRTVDRKRKSSWWDDEDDDRGLPARTGATS